MDSTLDRWGPWSVQQAGLLFAEAPLRWWISGGHALELHVGETWRSHEDLDVGGCRSQAAEAYGWLRGLDLYVSAAGRLAPWDGRPLDAARAQDNVWARESADSPWRFDLTLGSGTSREWVYRRDQSLTRPWNRAALKSASDIPYLAPDLQLLFKAKHPRPKDHVDAEPAVGMGSGGRGLRVAGGSSAPRPAGHRSVADDLGGRFEQGGAAGPRSRLRDDDPRHLRVVLR